MMKKEDSHPSVCSEKAPDVFCDALSIMESGDNTQSQRACHEEPGNEDANQEEEEPPPSPPPPCNAPPQHLGKHRQYWRDMILGVNDGLVSTFLLVAGVAGAGLTTTDVLLTAIAGALAGAVSMASGEYIATKSQNEVLNGEINLERLHIRDFRKDEIAELSELLTVIGIPEDQPGLREDLTHFYENRPDSLLKIMVALEFGVVDAEVRSPYAAGAASGLLFVLGSLPSVLPFVARKRSDPLRGLIVSAVGTCAFLLFVGAIKSWATRGNCLRAAVENLVVAGFGGALAYGVGVLFDSILK
jgi:VIT1/CCC1 family predicted Fe2+/Mn2+ transporter